MRKAVFTKKADVFAAGIVFLELLSLKSSTDLYDELWPLILTAKLPEAMTHVLAGSLNEEPANRLLFPEIFDLLQSETGLEIRNLTNKAVSKEFKDLIASLAASSYGYKTAPGSSGAKGGFSGSVEQSYSSGVPDTNY
jgi:hypothetical protein